jgi:hypothetical protein
MDKKHFKWILTRKFKELPKEFKLILFRNPNEFIKFDLERINPTHKIILWGLPKRKYRKDGTNKIYQVGRILIESFIPFIPMGILNITLSNTQLVDYILYALISYMSFNIGMFLGESKNDRLLFYNVKWLFYRHGCNIRT